MKLVKTYKLWFRNRKGSGLKKGWGTGKNDSLNVIVTVAVKRLFPKGH